MPPEHQLERKKFDRRSKLHIIIYIIARMGDNFAESEGTAVKSLSHATGNDERMVVVFVLVRNERHSFVLFGKPKESVF